MNPLPTFDAVRPPAVRHALVFTDVALLLAVSVTYVVATDGMLRLNLQQSFFKHAVGFFVACACFLHYMGAGINTFGPSLLIRGANKVWLWLVVLGLFIVAGSLYARFALDTRETFLIVGLYILVGYLFSRCLRTDNTERLTWALIMLGMVFATAIAAATVVSRLAHFSVKDTIIHEREFFVIPLLYLLAFTRRIPTWLRYVCSVTIVLGAFAALKSTPTIVLALTVALMWWRWETSRVIDRSNAPRRLLIGYFIIVGALVLGAAYAYYVSQVRQYTPSGNIDFRQHQYQIAWRQFLSSPFAGTGFTSETGIRFDLWYDPAFNGTTLPTHNDVLDLMRGGGVVAFLLWFVPLASVFVSAVRMLWRAGRRRLWTERHDLIAWLLATNLSAVVVYTFNPILAKTAFAMLVWMHFALLTAFVCLMRNDHES